MKLNKRLVTLGLLILILSVAGKFLWMGLRQIKVDDFHPSAVIFVIDSSASNQKQLPEQKKTLRQICNLLDPEDQIKILRVSEDAYLIYEGTPMNGSVITKSMDAFTQYDKNDYGTAYGVGLKKAFSHVLTMQKAGYRPAVIVMGDLENEGAIEKQINWNTLPQNVQNVKQYAPELSMMFLDAHPAKLDLVKEKLTPVLGEEHLIVSPKQNIDKSIRKFLHALGR
ncbi:TPA: VWA domain-containing protein [Candidatus Gastranaerophilales bacterium HUM_20]|nr:von Willebrand factor type A [Clostridium sp. CAG:729]DAB20265.1 MAG TPA: VWA domain-containing protein [Candidatus Gastranaerophilales bacterium HUM_20]